MQRPEVSGAVRPIYRSSVFKGLKLAVFGHTTTSTEHSAADLFPAELLSNEAGIQCR